MTDPFDPEDVREAWLRHGIGELRLWLQHIDEKTQRLADEQKAGRDRYIEKAELVFDYCAVLNRLGQISFRKSDHIPLQDFVPWLSSLTGWPLHVADAFWYCIRNPVLHMGRSFSMADYGRKHGGAHVMAGFHPDPTYAPPTEILIQMSPKFGGRGWQEVTWSDGNITVTFDLPGVREVAESVLDKVEAELIGMNSSDLRKLRKLGDRLPFLYLP